MTDPSHAAGAAPAAASTSSGRELSLPGWAGGPDSERAERDRLIAQARSTDAARQLQRCFPRWAASVRAPQLAGAGQAGQATSPSIPTTATRGAPPMSTRRRSCAATASRSTRAT